MTAKFQRVAHRGGAHLAPENTLAAFHNALTLPIDAIEIDVHMSRNGQAFIFHDHTMDRVTDGQGNILDLDLSYLQTLNAAAKFPGGWPEKVQIPTLHEVLELLKGRTQLYVEIKPSKRDGVWGRYPKIAETVVQELKAMDLIQDTLFISFDWFALQEVKNLEPEAKTGALVGNEAWASHSENALETLFEQVQNFHCDWLNIDYKLVTPDMVPAIQNRGFKLGVWTVNTLEALRHFAALGMDSLTTDRPDLFAQI